MSRLESAPAHHCYRHPQVVMSVPGLQTWQSPEKVVPKSLVELLLAVLLAEEARQLELAEQMALEATMSGQ